MATLFTDLPVMPARAKDSHKGTFGTVLVIGGSRGMAGAPALSAMAAIKSGAGLVQVGIPAEIQSIVSSFNPCYTTVGLPADDSGRLLKGAMVPLQSFLDRATVLAIGPGMGVGPGTPDLLLQLLQVEKAIVLDADALNQLALFSVNPLEGRNHPTILTPHPGEFGRMIGKSTDEIATNREELSFEYAKNNRCVVVLKGHETLVTDGEHLYRNDTGNPGMATGGSGDVLTGVIAALLGQGFEPFLAAQLGVYLHGRAGDIAATRLGMVSMSALDILHALPPAFQQHDTTPF
jgi:ADP-dependent NAD(P)H-hydrate dehydratase